MHQRQAAMRQERRLTNLSQGESCLGHCAFPPTFPSSIRTGFSADTGSQIDSVPTQTTPRTHSFTADTTARIILHRAIGDGRA